MATKSNKNLYIGIALLVVAVAVMVGVVLALNNKGGNGDSGDNGNGTSQDASGLSAADLSQVDVTVEYGDYDKMFSLAKDIQNGNATGKVVKIEGVVSHPMSSYSVVEANKGGTEKIGTQFIIEGETGYPNDKDRIVITGKVVELSPLVYVIKTLPEYVVVK